MAYRVQSYWDKFVKKQLRVTWFYKAKRQNNKSISTIYYILEVFFQV